jgi:hypothetical protein
VLDAVCVSTLGVYVCVCVCVCVCLVDFPPLLRSSLTLATRFGVRRLLAWFFSCSALSRDDDSDDGFAYDDDDEEEDIESPLDKLDEMVCFLERLTKAKQACPEFYGAVLAQLKPELGQSLAKFDSGLAERRQMLAELEAEKQRRRTELGP